jgi:hypothetical protein
LLLEAHPAGITFAFRVPARHEEWALESRTKTASIEPPILLSACLIVRNEEHNLSRCLQSIQGLVDECVIVDTGSTDGTVAIAKSFAARVTHEVWQDDFSLHRNQSLEQASGKWLFVIDADEEVVETDFEETRHFLDKLVKEPTAMVMEKLLLADGTSQVVVLPRLIRAGAGISYHKPIHEQLTAAADFQGRMSNVRMVHHGYLTREQTVAKQRRNLKIAMTLGNDLHGLHSQLRACLTLDLLEQAVDVSRRLLAMGLTSGLAMECCAMGGAAAVRNGDREALREFVQKGREFGDPTPDLALLEFLEAGTRYAAVVEEYGADDTLLAHLRAPTFRHNLPGIKRLLGHLGGMQRAEAGVAVDRAAQEEEQRRMDPKQEDGHVADG